MREMQVPLEERLRGVPNDERLFLQTGVFSSRSVPIGAMCHEAAAEITRLRDEVGAYKADAERYRWIRTYAGYAMPGALVRPDTEDEMDAAIDAARAALNQETK